jgi:hypothetical protein
MNSPDYRALAKKSCEAQGLDLAIVRPEQRDAIRAILLRTVARSQCSTTR